MAGKRESPFNRMRRDHAIEEGAKVVAAERSSYQKQRGGNTLLASAARIDLSDRRNVANMRRRRQAWQTEAWDYVSEIGEIRYVVNFAGNLMSKIRLFAAIRTDPNEAPVPIDDEEAGVEGTTAKIAIETLNRLRSCQGGQSALLRELTINWDVAGEAYLHGHQDEETGEEDWNIRSVDELNVTGDAFTLRGAPGATSGEQIPDDDLVIRLWERDSRFSGLATSPMRSVLSECEALLLLSREIRATSKSRLSNGILLMPQELSFGPVDPTRDQSDGEESDDPFNQELLESLIAPIANEGSAAAVAPLVVWGPAEFLKEIRHVTFDRPVDAGLDARIEGRIMRIARALNMPVEVTTGLQETTFANAAQVKKSEWDAHGEPRAVMICDALTAGYYQPALEEAGVPREMARNLIIWYDPADAIAAPDPVDFAEDAFKDFAISLESYRRVRGYSEADAPEPEEVLMRLLLNSGIRDANVAAQLLAITGLAPNIAIPERSSTPTPDEPIVAASQALSHLAEHNTLGKQLMDIDRDLRTRLRTAADAALGRALDRAGNKIISKARRDKSESLGRIVASTAPREVASALGPALVAANGFTDDELLGQAFDQFGQQFLKWTGDAQSKALKAIQRSGVEVPEATQIQIATEQGMNLATAWDVLQAGLMGIAAEKLYNPNGPVVAAFTILGENDGTYEIPASLIRRSMAIAGGDTGAWIDATGAVLATDGGPALAVAVSEWLFEGVGVGTEGYQWSHGFPKVPYEPHEQLDGQVFTDFGDGVVGDNFPGDHPWCTCDVAPIIIPNEEA